ncbi:MAG TPA: PadR family transcriptional regulator [Mycobacteriales bacterium]|nr:PadR family transcriptional regulator [Mycobacteriales bacterium]
MRALTPLALTVLRLLSQSPMHPYQLRCEIEKQGIDRMVRMTHGALYHTVDRLVEAELVEPVETSRSGRRPERTVYAITDAGRDAATRRLHHLLSNITPEFPSFRAALSFVSMLPPAEVSALLGRRGVLLEADLAAYQTTYDGLMKRGLARVSLLEVEHLLALTRAELDLTRSIVDDLDSGRLTWSADEDQHGAQHLDQRLDQHRDEHPEQCRHPDQEQDQSATDRRD